MSGTLLGDARIRVVPDTRGFESEASRSIGGAMKKVAGVAAAAFAAAGIGSFLKDAIGQASDLSETINKSNVIFGKNAGAIRDWSKSAATNFGLSQQAALDAAAGMGNMLQQLGYTGEAAAKASTDTVKLAADLGSFNNLETGDVLDRIGAAMRGEYDSLQLLIPNINAARVEQEAMAATGKTVASELTAQEKATATLAIVQRDGAAAANDFAETSDGLANRTKIASAQFDDMKAKLGTALLPAMTSVMGFISTTALPALGSLGDTLTDTVIPAVQSAGRWIGENAGPILTIAGLIAAVFIPHLVALGVSATVNAAKTVASFIATQASAIASAAVHSAQVVRMVASWALLGVQSLLQAARVAAAWVIAMGPIGWVGAAIAGLVALIVANWDTVVSGTKSTWSAVTGAIGAAWDWIKGAVSAALRFLTDLFLNFTGPGLLIKHWDSIVEGATNAWRWVVDRFTSMKDGVVGIFTSIRDTVGGLWDALLDKVKEPVRIVLRFINDSVIGNLNKITRAFGLTIPPIPIGFSTGGIVPGGYSPGRDNTIAAVGSGEAVMRPEWTRAMGADYVHAANRAARTGGVAGVRSFIQGGGSHFSKGGIVGRDPYTGSTDIGGPWDFAKAVGGKIADGAGNLVDAAGNVVGSIADSVGDAVSWTGDKLQDLVAKGVGFALDKVIRPVAGWVTDRIDNQFVSEFVSGAMEKMADSAKRWGDDRDTDAVADGPSGGSGFTGGGAPAGDGTLGSNWASLFATVKAQIPQARLNSGVRNSNDAHGRGKAVDFGFGTGPGGAGSAGLASINRLLHDRFGNSLYELIYDGIGDDRPDLKNGRPLTYNATTRLAHRSHVHAAVYDEGGVLEPGLTAVHNKSGKPEAVFTNEEWGVLAEIARGGGRGDVVLNLTVDPSKGHLRDQVEDAMFELRRIKRGGSIR
jgi:hypothetical protein